MAFPSSVPDLVNDSISRAAPEAPGDAPAVAPGDLFTADSQALSNALHNATLDQQQDAPISQAANVQGLTTLYSLDSAGTGIATRDLLHPGL